MSTLGSDFNPLSVPGLIDLLLVEKKAEAATLLTDHTNASRAEAESWVSRFPENIGKLTNSETIRATRKNGRIVVTYSGSNGQKQEVVPGEPLWEYVKSRMPDNELLEEAETQSYPAGVNPAAHSVFIEKDNTRLWYWIKITAVVMAFVALWYLTL